MIEGVHSQKAWTGDEWQNSVPNELYPHQTRVLISGATRLRATTVQSEVVPGAANGRPLSKLSNNTDKNTTEHVNLDIFCGLYQANSTLRLNCWKNRKGYSMTTIIRVTRKVEITRCIDDLPVNNTAECQSPKDRRNKRVMHLNRRAKAPK